MILYNKQTIFVILNNYAYLCTCKEVLCKLLCIIPNNIRAEAQRKTTLQWSRNIGFRFLYLDWFTHRTPSNGT